MGMMDTLINSVVGMAVVFAVLILLMTIIWLMSKFMKKSPAKTEAAAPAETVSAPSANDKPVPARGSCGELKLYDVPDKVAAQLMAIVAHKLQAPLNTLRFISIKEVK